MDISGWNTPK
ncbi:hypothetical protein COL71_26405 [Bacillus mycoides]|nr:hypothetical protein COL71_26405 [Bacillus mycoides]